MASGRIWKMRQKCATPSTNERMVSQFSRSPMWCERKALVPDPRQNVCFSSAPVARSGSGNASATISGSGAYPRERRRGYSSLRKDRVTESSQRMWIGRSWMTAASAIGASRSAASSSR